MSKEQGTVRVLPGSHVKGVLPHRSGQVANPTIDSKEAVGFSEHFVTLPAGHGVLFNPLLLHDSVPASTDRIRFVLLIQVQDLTTLFNPDDSTDPLNQFLEATKIRAEKGPLY